MKRLLDLVIAILALIAFAPLMLIVTLALRITSHGNALTSGDGPTQVGKERLVLLFLPEEARSDMEVNIQLDYDRNIQDVGVPMARLIRFKTICGVRVHFAWLALTKYLNQTFKA